MITNKNSLEEEEEDEQDEVRAKEADEETSSTSPKKKKKKKEKKSKRSHSFGVKQPRQTAKSHPPAKSPLMSTDKYMKELQEKRREQLSAAAEEPTNSDHPSDSLPEEWQGIQVFMQQIDKADEDSDTVQRIR